MGRLTVEQLAEISAKKKRARKFQEQFPPGSGKKREWAGVNDVVEKRIFHHPPRNKPVHIRSIHDNLKQSSALTRNLVLDIKRMDFFDNWTDGVGTKPVENPSAPLVIVDTSIITRAIGTNQLEDCRRIVDLATDGKIKPCVIYPLVKEYRVVIGRGKLPDNVRFDDKSLQSLSEFLARCLPLFGRPETFPPKVQDDSSDDILLIAQALAKEQRGRPCAVISRDKHVLDLPNARKSDILHPTILLARLAAAPQILFGV
jgi:hypothetical protein